MPGGIERVGGPGPPLTPRNGFLKDLAKFVLLPAAYYWSGTLGLRLAFLNASASPVWPPTGIALAALLVLGLRYWPAIWIGAFLVNITTVGTLSTSAGIANGNALEAVIGCWILTRFANGRRAFENAPDVFKFILLAAVPCTMIGATIGVSSLALAGFTSGDGFWPVWATWWLGDLNSALIVAPFLVVWRTKPLLRWDRRTTIEAVAMIVTVVGVGAAVMGGLLRPAITPMAGKFLTIPPLLWASTRFGQRGAVAATFSLAAVAIWGTLHDLPAAPSPDANDRLLIVQAFLAVAASVNLVLGALLAERDRSARALRKGEKELRRSLDEIENLYRTAPVGLCFVDDQLRFIRVNDLAARMSGLPAAEHRGRTIRDVLPDLADSLESVCRLVVASGQAVVNHEMSTAGHGEKGNRTEWLVGYHPVRGARGAVVAVSIVFQDITALKQVERALLESRSEERERRAELEAVMDATPAIHWIAKDPRCRTIVGNRAGNEVLRVPPGGNVSLTAPEAERPRHYEVFRNGRRLSGEELPIQVVARTGVPIWGDELEHRFTDNTSVWVYGNVVPLVNGDGSVRGAIAAFVDITARKAAEEASQGSETRLQALVNSAMDAILAVDARQRVVLFNPAAEKMFGCPASQALGGPLDRFIPARFRDAHREHVRKFDETGVTHRKMGALGALSGIRADGTEFPIEASISQTEVNGEKIFKVILRDITERVRAEAELDAWRRELEARVERRTADVKRAQEDLYAEIESRRRLEAEIADIVERERRGLGIELHEGICQRLTGIGYLLARLRKRLEEESPACAEDALRLQEMTTKSIEQVRSLAKGFYPVELDGFGLGAALEEMARGATEAFGVPCTVVIESPRFYEMKGSVAIQIYRLAREAVLDAIRRSHASRVSLRLAQANGDFLLEFEDDGDGPPSLEDEIEGIGPRIMEHRARTLGGTLEFRRGANGGTLITCSVPASKVLDQAPHESVEPVGETKKKQ